MFHQTFVKEKGGTSVNDDLHCASTTSVSFDLEDLLTDSSCPHIPNFEELEELLAPLMPEPSGSDTLDLMPPNDVLLEDDKRPKFSTLVQDIELDDANTIPVTVSAVDGEAPHSCSEEEPTGNVVARPTVSSQAHQLSSIPLAPSAIAFAASNETETTAVYEEKLSDEGALQTTAHHESASGIEPSHNDEAASSGNSSERNTDGSAPPNLAENDAARQPEDAEPQYAEQAGMTGASSKDITSMADIGDITDSDERVQHDAHDGTWSVVLQEEFPNPSRSGSAAAIEECKPPDVESAPSAHAGMEHYAEKLEEYANLGVVVGANVSDGIHDSTLTESVPSEHIVSDKVDGKSLNDHDGKSLGCEGLTTSEDSAFPFKSHDTEENCNEENARMQRGETESGVLRSTTIHMQTCSNANTMCRQDSIDIPQNSNIWTRSLSDGSRDSKTHTKKKHWKGRRPREEIEDESKPTNTKNVTCQGRADWPEWMIQIAGDDESNEPEFANIRLRRVNQSATTSGMSISSDDGASPDMSRHTTEPCNGDEESGNIVMRHKLLIESRMLQHQKKILPKKPIVVNPPKSVKTEIITKSVEEDLSFQGLKEKFNKSQEPAVARAVQRSNTGAISGADQNDKNDTETELSNREASSEGKSGRDNSSHSVGSMSTVTVEDTRV